MFNIHDFLLIIYVHTYATDTSTKFDTRALNLYPVGSDRHRHMPDGIALPSFRLSQNKFKPH